MATATLEKRDKVAAWHETMDEIYNSLRAVVETEENIGKFLVVEQTTKDYVIDRNLTQAALIIRSRHNTPQLYAYRIGYPATFSHGTRMERLS